MNLLIDGRPLVGNRTGIGVHTAEIARRLDVGAPPLLASHAPIEDRSGIEHCRFRVDRMSLGVAWQQLVLPRIEADMLWGPNGTLPLTARIPSVVTLHDFTSITMPGRHRLKTILSFNLFIGASLEKAARVACVSRAVADEAMRGFGVPASKIALVPNGVDVSFFSPGGEEGDYVLFTGTREPRKGLDVLVSVWESLPEPRPRLVLCGDAGWGDVVPGAEAAPHLAASQPVLSREAGEGLASPLPLAGEDSARSAQVRGGHSRIQTTGYVSRETLRGLYRGALAFVYPSRYEGFGIPPLEALACGAPVIATRTGAIPEFAGDAALLVPPGDPDALREALLRVLRDRELRRELRARGPERAAAWTWDASAAAMAQLLR